MANLERRVVRVRHVPFGPKDVAKVRAYVGYGDTFATHPLVGEQGKVNTGRYAVSHLPTGLTITTFSLKDDALQFLLALDRHGFWRVRDTDPEEVTRQLRSGGIEHLLYRKGEPPSPDQLIPIQSPLVPEFDQPVAFRVDMGQHVVFRFPESAQPFASMRKGLQVVKVVGSDGRIGYALWGEDGYLTKEEFAKLTRRSKRRTNPLLPEYRAALTSSSAQHAEALEAAMVWANITSERAYARGDYETAEAADAQAAELAEQLESYLEGLDESDNYEERQQEGWIFGPGRGRTDVSLDPDQFPASAEENVLSVYQDYLLGLGSFHYIAGTPQERQDWRYRDLVERLRYYLDSGVISAPADVTDEQLVAAARALWEEREAKRAAYKERRG